MDGYRPSTTVGVLRDRSGRVRPLLFDASPLLPSAVWAAAGEEVLTDAEAQCALLPALPPPPPPEPSEGSE
ncbi:hypothetical protein AB0M46_17695 [Dactylosporangium sp. NPDC051485]|uniref:hypothetical protein n=1 Tax=Dactylosporangium sp. NPDC051485 TaxID=3154846 RepID=UPI00343B4944